MNARAAPRAFDRLHLGCFGHTDGIIGTRGGTDPAQRTGCPIDHGHGSRGSCRRRRQTASNAGQCIFQVFGLTPQTGEFIGVGCGRRGDPARKTGRSDLGCIRHRVLVSSETIASTPVTSSSPPATPFPPSPSPTPISGHVSSPSIAPSQALRSVGGSPPGRSPFARPGLLEPGPRYPAPPLA